MYIVSPELQDYIMGDSAPLYIVLVMGIGVLGYLDEISLLDRTCREGSGFRGQSLIVFVWTVLNSGHRMFSFKNFKNFKILYTAALSKGAAEGGSGGSESPNKEH